MIWMTSHPSAFKSSAIRPQIRASATAPFDYILQANCRSSAQPSWVSPDSAVNPLHGTPERDGVAVAAERGHVQSPATGPTDRIRPAVGLSTIDHDKLCHCEIDCIRPLHATLPRRSSFTAHRKSPRMPATARARSVTLRAEYEGVPTSVEVERADAVHQHIADQQVDDPHRTFTQAGDGPCPGGEANGLVNGRPGAAVYKSVRLAAWAGAITGLGECPVGSFNLLIGGAGVPRRHVRPQPKSARPHTRRGRVTDRAHAVAGIRGDLRWAVKEERLGSVAWSGLI